MRYDKNIRKVEKVSSELQRARDDLDALKRKHEHLNLVVEGLMHEARRFSGELSAGAEELSRHLNGAADARAKDLAETVFYTTGLLSSRMAFADFELNPQVMSRQIKLRTGIYKKFDKARHILSKRAKTKNIEIQFVGKSQLEVDAYQAFELVPFVLLENAIKYSPPKQDVTITFDEVLNRSVSVKVLSLGPIVSSEEMGSIFDRGIRGQRAIDSNIPGEGLGLYLANTLCKMNGFYLSATSAGEQQFTLNSTPYSLFEVSLQFQR